MTIMKKEKTIIFANTILLIIVLLYPWKEDMMFRFATVVLIFHNGILLIPDKKIQIVNKAISLFFFLLVLVLGFWYNFYKY